MTFDYFRLQYGEAFYQFINSELGQAMLVTLEKNDPASRVGSIAPSEQTSNSTLFLGQITGWRDAIKAITSEMIVTQGEVREPQATYEQDFSIAGFGNGETAPPPKPPEPPIFQPVKPKRKTK